MKAKEVTLEYITKRNLAAKMLERERERTQMYTQNYYLNKYGKQERRNSPFRDKKCPHL